MQLEHPCRRLDDEEGVLMQIPNFVEKRRSVQHFFFGTTAPLWSWRVLVHAAPPPSASATPHAYEPPPRPHCAYTAARLRPSTCPSPASKEYQQLFQQRIRLDA